MSHPQTLSDWLTLLESRHPLAIDLGLERVSAVWERMGRPRPARRLITVAGTNGKGSTTAYIASMLDALGFSCGSYTSPHLVRYNERVQIRGEMVSDHELVSAFAQIESARGEISLSYFEFGTLAAFALMSRAALDFAVLEVGLGGRLDAVNILAADCAVITPVGLDHQEYLGPDRESIGREKAGIIRPGTPLICGESDPPQSLLQVARQAGAPIFRLGKEFLISTLGKSFYWQLGDRGVQLPQPPMAGIHQVDNMATAVAAVAVLVPEALEQPADLARGILSASMAGRLQNAIEDPRVWLDVGHNTHAAGAVAVALLELNLKPQFCVLGMLRDKDATGVAKALDQQVKTWCCAGITGARGRNGEDLAAEVLKVSGPGRTHVFDDVAAALRYALAEAAPNESILVFGSFITVGQAAAFLASGLHPN